MIDTKRLVLHTLKQIYDSILAIQDLNRGQIDWNRFFFFDNDIDRRRRYMICWNSLESFQCK